MSKVWKILSTEELFRTRFFRLRSDRCELPDARVMPNYYVMEFPDWANVVPITDDNQMVLIRQYRHATGEVYIEIPGGSTHPGQTEDPKEAAVRELLEETGYAPREVRFLAKHRPNPAMQTNFMHTYLATGCRKVAEPTLDPFEDIELMLTPIPKVLHMIEQGQIDHSIILASLLFALPHLK